MEFKDQYKHPLWQKKRLEALEFADYCCECCQSMDSQLHVHHKRYIKGRLIWEYALDELDVLCHECHEEAHRAIEQLRFVQSLIPSNRIADAALVLAGWITYTTGEESSIPCSNPDAFYAGRLAGYGEAELGGMLCDMATEIRPDITEKFIREGGEK